MILISGLHDQAFLMCDLKHRKTEIILVSFLVATTALQWLMSHGPVLLHLCPTVNYFEAYHSLVIIVIISCFCLIA